MRDTDAAEETFARWIESDHALHLSLHHQAFFLFSLFPPNHMNDTLQAPPSFQGGLTLNQFQELASRTLPAPGRQHWFGHHVLTGHDTQAHAQHIDLIHASFGLAGEVGELIDPIKKAMFYGKPLDVENVKEEAADALWYIGGPLCRALGITLEDLARHVTTKLQKRYPEKYTDEAAIDRADKKEEPTPVHTDSKCVFNYCPTPDACKEGGCQSRQQ